MVLLKDQYGDTLENNLSDLISRMTYRPSPVREVLIPKEGKPGATRPLGISNFEDKVVQLMMQRVFEHIYEPLFLDCSYGFRPKRSCHDAVKSLHQHLCRHRVSTVINIDLKAYFDTIDHNLLEEMLRTKIKDERFMRYVVWMFRSRHTFRR